MQLLNLESLQFFTNPLVENSRLRFKRLNLTSCQEDSLQSVAKLPNETKNIKEKVSFNTAIHFFTLFFYSYPNGTAGTI